jgi:hypothetical protein
VKIPEYKQPSKDYRLNVVTLLYDGATGDLNTCGPKPLAGMHGYHPDDKDSVAAFMTNTTDTAKPAQLADIYALMRAEAEWAPPS